MKKLLRFAGAMTLLLIVPALFAQTVTFAPQGAAILKNQAGQVVKGVQILDLNVCSAAPATVPNGFVYQTAVANGFSAIGPTMGTALLNQKIAMNWKHFLVTFVTNGAIDAAVGGLTGVVAMPASVIKGLAIGHAFMDQFGPQLLATAPAASPVLSILLDPSKNTVFQSAGCVEASMLATYAKGAKPVGPVLISTNAPVAPVVIPASKDEALLNTERVRKIMAAREEAVRVFEQSQGEK